MKSIFLATLCFVIFASSCEKTASECVQNKIDDFKRSNTCPKANVKQYLFQGRTVYAFDPGPCGADMITKIIEADCTILGSLGGYFGNTKINGAEFSEASLVKTIWQK